MKIKKEPQKESSGTSWAEHVWKISWTYIRTVVDTVHEPFVILDEDLRVIAANEAFYRVFEVPVKDTEGKLIYELGDGQWNISALKTLLKDILSKDTFFKGFEVKHEFPQIGHKIMLLNARRIHQHPNDNDVDMTKKPIILLAIEDITEFTLIAEKLASKTQQYETKMIERSEELALRITELANLDKTMLGFSATLIGLSSTIDTLKKEVTILRTE